MRNICFISVTGKDRPGITAKISKVLADNNISILDVNQRIVGDTFGLSMAIDLPERTLTIPDLRRALSKETENFEIKINVMHEDVIKAIHRI